MLQSFDIICSFFIKFIVRNIIIFNFALQTMSNKKLDPYCLWRQNHRNFYHFIYQNFLDWPATSIQWGPMLNQNSEVINQRVYFSCKTDGVYSPNDCTWTSNPNYIVLANVELPKQDHYSIPELKSIFNYDAAKKHPNIKVKQIISHPGEITVIRASPMNRKLLASKSDTNNVYIWTSDKYKPPQPHPTLSCNFANTPDVTLQTYTSENHNYALRFTPSLPRLISASGNRLQLFDIQGPGSSKRELGSMTQNSVLKPLLILQGHDGVQDISFKNNEICLSGGQDKEIGIWDLRIGSLEHKIKQIHENDINALSCKGNYIVSGGQEGRINIIDDRMLKVIQRFEQKTPIHGLQFDPISNHLAVGKQYLSIYNLDNILQTHTFQPLFTHYGLRGNINQFDWNNQSPMTIAQTYQDPQPEASGSQGGIIHIYSPLDLFFMKKSDAKQNIELAFNKLSQEQKHKLIQSL